MIQSAQSTYSGRDVNCILLSGSVPTTPALRNWVENEYCIEPSSGLLQMWSEAPGIYVNYDYSGALQFHGHALPSQISIVENGITVRNIHLESIAAPGEADSNLFEPTAEMLARGPSL